MKKTPSSVMAPRNPPRFRARVRRQAVVLLWLANVGLGAAVGTNYLAHVPDVDSGIVWLFALLALLSSVVSLTLLPGIVFWIAAQFVPSTRALGMVQAASWTFFQVLLYTDTRLFNIFRYHVNGQVLNLVYTRGSEDAIHLGWQVWTALAVGFGSVGWLQGWIWRRALRLSMNDWRSRTTARLRPVLAVGLVLASAIFAEKTIYAKADLSRDRQVTTLARLFPMYARVPMEDLANRVMGVESDKPPRVELAGLELDYPREVPEIDPNGPRPNFLIIVIDCWRQDLLEGETTPNAARWAKEGRRFRNHVSGGNSTRYGLFSMLYGLHGSYWFPFLQNRRAPVLIDALVGAGYEAGVFSAASQNYPEMRATAWSSISDKVRDDFGPLPSWRRDELAADAMVAWLGEREADSRPFFGFILLDSPHQTYSHPPDRVPFTPSAAEMDYLAVTRNEGPEPEVLEQVKNRYRNAVHHADAVAGRILAAIEESSLLDETVVILTADHGEEFWECGFFGHTSAFTPQQIAVPFVMRGPGILPGDEYLPTSHIDLPATLLELVGANPTRRRLWTLGQNLFEPSADRRRVVSGWNELGVWTPTGILRVPLSLFEFDVEVYDYGWQLLLDDRDVLDREAASLIRLGAECNRFLR